MAKRQHSKAVADLDRAIKLDPNRQDAYCARGTAWMSMGQNDIATTDFDQAIKLDPHESWAYTNRGLARSRLGDAEGALRDFDEAIRLDPKVAAYFNNRAIAWATKKDYDRALADLGESIRLDPKRQAAYFVRARVETSKKDYGKAIEDYDMAIRLSPKEATAYNNLGWLLATCPDEQFRDGRRAIEMAKRACELSGWHNAAYLGTLAAAHAEAGDYAAAAEIETKAQSFCDTDAQRNKCADLLTLFRARTAYRDTEVTNVVFDDSKPTFELRFK
jgi:tetratricopeptide (TPR) repeat protein